jgi:hypothetical protein
MTKKLSDATYDQEIERMSHLTGFPHVPKEQLQLRRALRRVTDVDGQFLHRLVSDLIDSSETCPTPDELGKRAEELRREHKSAGRADCPKCHGSGFVSFTRRVEVPGMEPYVADLNFVCRCRGTR